MKFVLIKTKYFLKMYEICNFFDEVLGTPESML